MLLVCCFCLLIAAAAGVVAHAPHTSNYALIVDTSMNYFNYRHISNTLAVYRAVKAGGIPDSNIILMLAEDIACNARNVYKGSVFDDDAKEIDLFDEQVQVDYRGEEVTVENVLRVISGRHFPGTPQSKRLDSTPHSNLLLYFSGHGGDGFLKFRDTNTMSAPDIAAAVAQMKEKGRFREMLFIVDTCQADTLFEEFGSIRDVVAIGSSRRGENSYSLKHDYELGVGVSDRFTYHLLRYFETSSSRGRAGGGSLEDLFQSFSYDFLMSHASWSSTLNRSLKQVRVSDFFSAVLDVKVYNAAKTEQSSVVDDAGGRKEEENGIATGQDFYREEFWGTPSPLFVL